MDVQKKQINEEVRINYMKTGSIRATVKATGVSRNKIRRVVKECGLYKETSNSKKDCVIAAATKPDERKTSHLSSYSSVTELFGKTGTEDALSEQFKKYILELEKNLTSYFEINSEIDKLRLEMAILQYTAYRRFLMRSLEASQKYPVGRFVKKDQKYIREIRDWTDAADKALDRFNQLMRELEVRYGKRSPDSSRNTMFIQNQLNVVK